jgi:superfamily II DNA or RNA helicase
MSISLKEVNISFTPFWCTLSYSPTPSPNFSRELLIAFQQLEQELDDALKFHTEGYYFSPQYQSGGWDGYTHLYHLKTHRFRAGMLLKVLEFLEVKSIGGTVFNFPDPQTFCQNSNTYTLRPYQLKAAQDVCKRRFGILQAPPRAGKTNIIIAITDSERRFPAILFCRSLDLAYQTVERFRNFLPSVSVGLVGDGKCDIQDITIMTVQSAFEAFNQRPKNFDVAETDKALVRDVEKASVRKLITDAEIVFYDECFPKGTLVHTDVDTVVPIEAIYENQDITHVLSYNKETRTLERKRILKKTKREISKDRLFLVETSLHKGGKKYKVRCTDTHKFWTNNRGYVEAKDLCCNDSLKVLTTGNIQTTSSYYHVPVFCKRCGTRLSSYKKLKQHNYKCHTKEGQRKTQEHARKMCMEREKNRTWRKNLKLMGLRRRGKNNTVFRHPDTIKKIRETHRRLFRNMPKKEQLMQIKRFMNAPIHKRNKINRPEKTIISFKFKGLEYTAKGYHNDRKETAIELILGGRERYKFPDFTYKKRKKVIEVADFEYWHTRKEMNKVKYAYKKAGWDCLVLNAKQVVEFPDKIKRKIVKFLYNHNVSPIKVGYSKIGFYKPTVTVYNLEIEDNHNYFANGFLVSNCHHSSAKTSRYILDRCKNAVMRIGVSATPFEGDSSDWLVEESIGPVIHKISYSELVKEGYILRPYIYMYKLPPMNLKGDAYRTVYKKAVTHNDYLTGLIKKIVDTLTSQGNSVVVQTEFIEHTKLLAEVTGGVMLTGQERDMSVRTDVLQRLRSKEILCVVSTLFEEGLDVASLDYTINVAGGLSNIGTLQRMRSLTASEGKETCGIIDFYHQCEYLERHSKIRRDIYTSEEEFVFEMRDVSKLKLEEIE